MKSKKVLALCLAAAMTATMTAPVAAEESPFISEVAINPAFTDEIMSQAITGSEIVVDEETGKWNIMLKNDHVGFAGETGNKFDRFEVTPDSNKFQVKDDIATNDPASDFSFWHFIDSTGHSEYAYITFTTPDAGQNVCQIYPDAKTGNEANAQLHYEVLTPSDWKLTGGYCVSDPLTDSSDNTQFNLSHSGRHEAEVAEVTVTANVNAYHNVTTTTAYYNQNIIRKNTQFIHSVYNVPVYDVYQYGEHDVYKPTFEKSVLKYGEDTLVTRLTYDEKTDAPSNGGAFKNGHTYVKIDLNNMDEKAEYVIADSSKKTGKKTSAQYNRPLVINGEEAKYVVEKTTDENGNAALKVSVPEYTEIPVRIHAEVVADPTDFDGNVGTHEDGSFTVTLPENSGVVYLYTHIEGGIRVYEKDNKGEIVWRFTGWENTGTVQDETPTLIEKDFHDEPEFAYEVTDRVETEVLMGSKDLVGTEETTTSVPDEFDPEFVLTVSDGETTETKELNKAFELEPGTYTFTLTGANGISEEKEVIVDREDKTVDFGTIDVHLTDKDETNNEEVVNNVYKIEWTDPKYETEKDEYIDKDVADVLLDGFFHGEDEYLGSNPDYQIGDKMDPKDDIYLVELLSK